MNELELDEREQKYNEKIIKFKKFAGICIPLAVIIFISAIIVHSEYLALVAVIIIFLGAIIPLQTWAHFLHQIPEEIKLSRQLLKTQGFKEVIDIWQEIWDSMSQNFKREILEKGLQLAKTPQEIAFIYKISPTSSEVETKALETLLIKIKEEKNENFGKNL